MDFNDSPAEAEFRAEVGAWLEANVPTKKDMATWSGLELAKMWQKRKYDAGWACIHWPKEYGGRGASAIEQVIFNQEESKYPHLPAGYFSVGQGHAAPTLMTWAKEEDKVRYLPPIASGEEVWCQLFSEPAAGSDLAALRTRAVKDGEEWIVNGQKIWTSGAHFSNYGILVVRTDPDVPKHKGLSYFYLDMNSPGLEIKPIKQLSGDTNFNEVYFTDVRIPDSQRLGKVGQGWRVALTTLMNERASIGGGREKVGVNRLIELAQLVEIDGAPAIEDSAIRAMLANWYCRSSGLKYTGHRSITALSRGEVPGPETSIGKLVGPPMSQDMASFAMDLLEMTGAVWDDESPLGGVAQLAYMSAPGSRIGGGTDEIMANIIAERVLGLPQEPRMDKGIPFTEVPTGVD